MGMENGPFEERINLYYECLRREEKTNCGISNFHLDPSRWDGQVVPKHR
jgi:hypothetical protein